MAILLNKIVLGQQRSLQSDSPFLKEYFPDTKSGLYIPLYSNFTRLIHYEPLFIMTEIEKYESLMRRCIELAKIAKSRGDSPVGSVIVKDGQIVGEGIEGGKTHNDVTFHAEIEAVRNAIVRLGKTDLSDCFMVTTHEPCIMCSYVIRHYKIGLIIVGMTTGEIGGYSSALPVLLDRTISKWTTPPTIIDKILEQECKKLYN